MTQEAQAPSSPAHLWFTAARPKTLLMSLSPVLAGSALAWTNLREDTQWIALPFILLAAIAIQIGTNLYNDACDSDNGTDHLQHRLGPPRVTANGWLSSKVVKTAAYLCFATALAAGLYLVQLGGWPVLAFGIAALISGLAYSAGPYPISRSPLGELFVIAFFGVGAVMGTHYLLGGALLSDAALFLGLALGSFAAAVLLVNNDRDRVSDYAAGRRTLAILIGAANSRKLFRGLLMAPFVLMVAGRWIDLFPLSTWFTFVVLAGVFKVDKAFEESEPSAELNPILGQTVLLQCAFAVIASGGLIFEALR